MYFNTIVSLVRDIDIDDKDPSFRVISNYNSFHIAKMAGRIDCSITSLARMLKYEMLHANRPAMKVRLFGLLTTAIKDEARIELGICDA